MKLKKAMILAAGFGKRLTPLTQHKPKALIKIGKKTLLENCILILEKFGINEIVINTHYLSNKIENYIRNKKFSANINVIKEQKIILDTGGGIFNATKRFDKDPFLVLNPDTIWNEKYIKEFELLEKIYFKNNFTSLLLVNKNRSFDKNFKGDFNLNEKNKISRNTSNQMIYTGAQIINRRIFEKSDIEPFSMNKVWDKLIKTNSLVGCESQQQFLHVNTSEIYKKIIVKYFTD